MKAKLLERIFILTYLLVYMERAEANKWDLGRERATVLPPLEYSIIGDNGHVTKQDTDVTWPSETERFSNIGRSN